MPTLKEINFLAENKHLLALKQKIEAKFAVENWDELGEVTDCQSYVQNHSRLKRSLHFGDLDYPDCVLAALSVMSSHRDGNLALIEDYVAKVFPEEFIEVDVSSHTVERTKIVFRPTVFDVPSEGVQKDLVAVMMPFAANFKGVYKTIQNAAAMCFLNCQRVDDVWINSTIIQDVFSLIYRSHIVVCDFSGRNPNVMYEAGIAHTLGKHVIPITQNTSDVPFDLSHHRHLAYLNNSEGLNDLEDKLAARMMNLASK